MKPNCYECKYRGEIPGDAHSRCNHPLVKQNPNVFGALSDMLLGKNDEAAFKLKILANPVGVKRGWFLWPANFDPTWLENCEGFTNQSPAVPPASSSPSPSNAASEGR